MMSRNAARTGRMTEIVEFYAEADPTQSDDDGYPLPRVLQFSAWANVQVKSAKQKNEMGTEINENVITVLMRSNASVNSSLMLRWNNTDYEIQGDPIPDESNRRNILITALVDRHNG